MKKDKKSIDQNLEKINQLATIASEGRFDAKTLKGFVKEEFSRMKELSELAYKEGISKLLSLSKQGQSIPSLAREQIAPKSNDRSSETSMMSSARALGKKLPKLQREESTLSKPQGDSSPPLPGSIVHSSTRLSPQLQPLFTVTNSVARAGFKSRVGTIRGKPKLHNQDCIIIKPNLQNIRGQYLFGVCDGHGAQGHSITELVKEQFVPTVELLLPLEPKVDQIQKALISAVEKVASALANTQIDIVFSGSTLISVVISGNNCVCANLGDCKAVIGRETEKWQAIGISSEHTIGNKKERERMVANNARIAEDVNENGQGTGVEKIYLGNQDVPGLEITRSFGDKIGKFIGMISTPELKSFTLQTEDKFLIIGSSGFWRYITGIEAVCIVRYSWESNKIEQSCEDLVSEVDRRWKSTGSDKDDITVVVVYLNVT